MNRRAIVTTICFGICVFGIQDQLYSQDTEKVEKLISQLGANGVETRRTAERSLIELGKQAVPSIVKLVLSEDGSSETRARCQSILLGWIKEHDSSTIDTLKKNLADASPADYPHIAKGLQSIRRSLFQEINASPDEATKHLESCGARVFRIQDGLHFLDLGMWKGTPTDLEYIWAFDSTFQINNLSDRRLLKVLRNRKVHYMTLRWSQNVEHEIVVDAQTATDFTKISGLRTLDTANKNITPEGMERLSRATSLESLTMRCALDADILQHLSKFAKLNELDLSNCKLAVEDMRHLQGMKSLATLKTPCKLMNDTGIDHVLKIPNLKTLMIHDAQVTDKGIKKLTDVENLEFILLSYCHRLTDETVRAIANSMHLVQAHLTYLQISDDCLKFLEGTNVNISLGDLFISQAAVDSLTKKSPSTIVKLRRPYKPADDSEKNSIAKLMNLGVVFLRKNRSGKKPPLTEVNLLPELWHGKPEDLAELANIKHPVELNISIPITEFEAKHIVKLPSKTKILIFGDPPFAQIEKLNKRFGSRFRVDNGHRLP